DAASQTESLYLDGRLIGSTSGWVQVSRGGFVQLGTGYTQGWPAGGDNGWDPFHGEIGEVRIWSGGRSGREIQPDMATGRSGAAASPAWSRPIASTRGRA